MEKGLERGRTLFRGAAFSLRVLQTRLLLKKGEGGARANTHRRGHLSLFIRFFIIYIYINKYQYRIRYRYVADSVVEPEPPLLAGA